MNTITNHHRNGISFPKNIQQKLSFPNIFYSPSKSNISKYKNKNVLSLSKINNKYPDINYPITYRNRNRAKLNIKMVKILTFEEKINDILKKDLEQQKQKEKIDNNNTIKMLRLGLYKRNENNDNNYNENNKKNEFSQIMQIEKEKEEDLEKIDNENKEKEKKLEKNFREKLIDFDKIKNECLNINTKINKINEKIEDKQLDANVLTNYADKFEQKYKKQISQSINERYNNNKEKSILNEKNEMNEINKKKDKQFEELNKLIIYKQQKEDKKKFLKEIISEKQKIKEELEKDLISKKTIYIKSKKELENIRTKLLNSYHLKLYEGLHFHNEGLATIIKDIWNLGLNVNTNFMPTYLDKTSIEFLFQRAKYSIELSKLLQTIKENEKELSCYIKEWKLNNNEINNKINQLRHSGFFNKNDEHKNTKAITNENELFKTKISDISISYLDPYPKTKEFMIEYKKKHPNIFQKDMPDGEIRHFKFQSLGIPAKIMEKNKKIENLKNLLKFKIELNKQNDKKEVERLTKEYIKNNYQHKYKVNIETLFGALFGDKKNEMLIYYTKLEKEYRDGKKIIQFHT